MNTVFFDRCLGDYGSAGGPVIALFLSIYPICVAVIITACYVGVWITIQVNILGTLGIICGTI